MIFIFARGVPQGVGRRKVGNQLTLAYVAEVDHVGISTAEGQYSSLKSPYTGQPLDLLKLPVAAVTPGGSHAPD